MGFLSGLFRWLKNLIVKLGRLLKKIWPILAIALIVFAPVIMPVLASMWTAVSGFLGTAAGWISTAWSGISAFAGVHGWGTTAALGFGALSVVSPSTAKSVVSRLGEVAGTVAETAGGFVSTVFKSPLLLLAGGGLVFYLLSKDDD